MIFAFCLMIEAKQASTLCFYINEIVAEAKYM